MLHRVSLDWLGVTRSVTQYAVPAVLGIALIAETAGLTSGIGSFAVAYNWTAVVVFTLLTLVMIGACGWLVFLWDIDRLFFKLESRIDSQAVEMDTRSPSDDAEKSLLQRLRDAIASEPPAAEEQKSLLQRVRDALPAEPQSPAESEQRSLLHRLKDAIAAESAAPDEDVQKSLLQRAREAVAGAIEPLRAQAVAEMEQNYWKEINAGGVLAFPQPDIAKAIEQIDKSRGSMVASITEVVAGKLSVGGLPAALISRLIVGTVGPQVKVRLYRRLVLRFLAQLGALFALAAACFYFSILAWSRLDATVFNGGVSAIGVLVYQLDLMLRGAFFDVMEHTHRSITPVAINQKATAFVYYTLLFRMFVAAYMISSVVKVGRFAIRRWWQVVRSA